MSLLCYSLVSKVGLWPQTNSATQKNLAAGPTSSDVYMALNAADEANEDLSKILRQQWVCMYERYQACNEVILHTTPPLMDLNADV